MKFRCWPHTTTISLTRLGGCLAIAALSCLPAYQSVQAQEEELVEVGKLEFAPPKPPQALRIATYNVSLNRPTPGALASDLKANDEQARAVAAVIRAVQPDILLLNELDYDPQSDNAKTFAERYLAAEQRDGFEHGPWAMPFIYSGPVNTGVPSGLDLNNDGKVEGPNDAWGYGRFPGQYGMAVLSRYELDVESVRSYQKFLWSNLPGAMRPKDPDEAEYYYDDETWSKLRLSSKSFWDVPVKTPYGTLHVLASHPTPPAFDGPEDRNGHRNHDEIRMLQLYIENSDALTDDSGQTGGLGETASFVIVGDLNSDPVDGSGISSGIRDLLGHPRVAQFSAPTSDGAVRAAKDQSRANEEHQADPAADTADFNDRSVGNLRVDYVLPSSDCRVVQSGVFWPEWSTVPASLHMAMHQSLEASDHHLVWVDVVIDDGK